MLLAGIFACLDASSALPRNEDLCGVWKENISIMQKDVSETASRIDYSVLSNIPLSKEDVRMHQSL